ncbi:hypothetical protein Ddye_032349 [Dipteronia dyeriana]|uniref:Serine aminopeptidase S33 domain-containing protein n=1 Tax=Dipteronia dyeriana TaxID=168575 RepID=A0AAD9TKP2_9ROSI|nr:hypothetical protein Ddye_032349 [Dipteronia dyeriana]
MDLCIIDQQLGTRLRAMHHITSDLQKLSMHSDYSKNEDVIVGNGNGKNLASFYDDSSTILLDLSPQPNESTNMATNPLFLLPLISPTIHFLSPNMSRDQFPHIVHPHMINHLRLTLLHLSLGMFPTHLPHRLLEKKMSNMQEFILNSRGMRLFTCSWLPINPEPKALIFICHGYAMECSITMKGTAIQLVNTGFRVYEMDYEGHGRSSGLQAFVDNFDMLVDDCSIHFTNVCDTEENRGKMRFLLGESMGGAVALLLHRKKPNYCKSAMLQSCQHPCARLQKK